LQATDLNPSLCNDAIRGANIPAHSGKPWSRSTSPRVDDASSATMHWKVRLLDVLTSTHCMVAGHDATLLALAPSSESWLANSATVVNMLCPANHHPHLNTQCLRCIALLANTQTSSSKL
jgi:hypothetical protein